MSFLRKLTNLFSAPASRENSAYWIYVRCNRCGENIRSRVDMVHDLSVNYSEQEADTTYFTRKALMGEQRCYQLVEVELTFDHRHQLIDRQVKGGEFITEADYAENL
jgi:hypothetical protein